MKKELTASKIESPTKKVLVIAAIILATLCMIFLLQSANGMTANAAQSGTVISKKLLEDNTYKEGHTNELVSVFKREDNTAYKVVRYDGKIVTIDNSDGQIEDIYPCTSTGVGYQILEVYSEDGGNSKKALLDYNGNYLTGKKEFYDDMGLLNQEHNKDYYYRIGTSLYICAEDGTRLCPVLVNLPEDIFDCNVVSFGSNYGIAYQTLSSYGHSYRIIDREGNLIREGNGQVLPSCLEEHVYNETTGYPEFVYYDTNLNPISALVWNTETYHNELAPNVKDLEEGEIPAALSELEIDRMVTIGNTTYYRFVEEYYGLVDSNGNKIFPHADFIGDHILAVEDENGYYNAIELSSVPTGVASIDKQADGNMSASLIAAGTTDTLFELNAPKDTVSDGCIFKVTKLENTDKTVANAKTVLKEKINKERFTAYDISLLNSKNEKIQPKGVLSITTLIPSGYDTNKVAVYRINDDNTYTELKSTIANGKITFETDHFSTYVIAEKAVAASPKTGDTSFGILWLILLSIAAMVLCSRKLWKQA